MKIAIVVGNRPHFVKSAPLLKILKDMKDVQITLIHTGQHYDANLSDVFFKDFHFPKIDFNLAVGSAPNGVQTGMILSRLDPIYRDVQPDRIVCMGDTNTTLAAALAGYQQHIPTAHIEAGMREYIWRPEEINKIIADQCADYLFAPLPRAGENLKKEGIPGERIFVVGDITYDTFLHNRESANDHFTELQAEWGNIPESYDLITLHRAETVDNPELLKEMLQALSHWDHPVVFPVHPRTSRRIEQYDLDDFWRKNDHVIRKPPLSYFDFLALLLNARLIATDSSGVLKESFYAEKPCLLLDETTEYDEIMDLKAARKGGRNSRQILATCREVIDSGFPEITDNPFGRGNAADKIVDILLNTKPFFS